MFQRKTKLIYWASVLIFLVSAFSGLAAGLVSADPVAPGSGSGTGSGSVTAGGVNNVNPGSTDINVQVDVQISSLNGKAVGANTFSGDTIVQSGDDFYIEDSSGTQIAQIPSAINLAVYDVINGNQIGTYCYAGDNPPNTILPCGSDYAIPGTGSADTITAGGVIDYWAAVDQQVDDPTGYTDEELGGKSAVTLTIWNALVGCPSGPNITTSDSCGNPYGQSAGAIKAIEADWLIPDDEGGSNQILTHTKISLPLTNYTVPADLATSATTPTDPSGDASGTPSCTSSAWSLSWIMCPLIDGMAKAVDGIYGDLIEPLLATPPIAITQPADCVTPPPTGQSYPADCDVTHTYAIWSQFRTYGNIFLVLALLGLVFGEVIGGGIIQAYTAKKMLPRILLAVILINLSIYIVAGLLDITNVIGTGMSQLISAPFTAAVGAGAFKLTINGTTSGIGLFAFVGAAGAGIWALTLAPELIMMFLLFTLLPALLAMLAILFTVVIRQGLIIFLVISSPVAFALYVLPNTEQYFKKWWHLLFTTLLVYPIIAVVFAMANALSVTLSNTAKGQNGGLATLSQLVAMVAIIMPLFLIPFSFKIAGGVMGAISGGLQSLGKRAASAIPGDAKNENSLQNKLRRAGQNIGTRRGNKLKNYLRSKTTDGDNAFKDSWLGNRKRGLANQALKRLPTYERRQAAINRREAELANADTASGADGWQRAGFATEQMEDETYTGAHGETFTKKKGHYYSHAKDSDGKLTEFAKGDVDRAKGWMKGNAGRFQTALTYEIGKASNDQELLGVDKDGNTIYDASRIGEIDPSMSPGGSLLGNALDVAKEAKLGSGAAAGAFQGAFFTSQAQYRQLKGVKMSSDYSGFKFDADSFVQDYGNNMGLYTSSNSKPALTYTLLDYYKKLEKKRENGEALSTVEKRSYKTLQATARSFDERLRAENQRGGGSVTAETVQSVSEDGTPIAGTGAAVNVSEAMSQLVKFQNDNNLGDVDIDTYVGKQGPPNPHGDDEAGGPSAPNPVRPSGGPSQPSSGGSVIEPNGEMHIDHGVAAPSPTLVDEVVDTSSASTRSSTPSTQVSPGQPRATRRPRRGSTTSSQDRQPQAGVVPTITPPNDQAGSSDSPTRSGVITPTNTPNPPGSPDGRQGTPTRPVVNNREVQPEVIVPEGSSTTVDSPTSTQPPAEIVPTTKPDNTSRSSNPTQSEVITPTSPPDSRPRPESDSGDRNLNISVTRSSVTGVEPPAPGSEITPSVPDSVNRASEPSTSPSSTSNPRSEGAPQNVGDTTSPDDENGDIRSDQDLAYGSPTDEPTVNNDDETDRT